MCCFSSSQCLNTRKVSGFLSLSAWMMKYKLIKLYKIFFSPGKLALSQGMKMCAIQQQYLHANSKHNKECT